jgi:hypothetical protein
MFGRHKKEKGDEEMQIPVDATLEDDIARVERTSVDYLAGQTPDARQALLAALEKLDDQTQQSDEYGRSVIGSAALGYGSKGEVLGETGIDSVVNEVPSDELNAQFALVKAAKDEVRDPTSETLASLRSAVAALGEARK